MSKPSTESEVNPYEPTFDDQSVSEKRRSVVLFLASGTVALLLGCQLLYPGLVLLNQKWELIPVESYIYGININGAEVSETTAMSVLLVLAAICLGAATFLLKRAYSNWRHNRFHHRGLVRES